MADAGYRNQGGTSEWATHGLTLTFVNVPLPKIPQTGQLMVEPLRQFGHVTSLKTKGATTTSLGLTDSTL